MALCSISRFLSFSILPKTHKYPTLQFATSSPAEQFYHHLQKNTHCIEKTLPTINVKLDSICVNEVLQKCSSEKPHMGLRFFIWAGLQSKGYRHSSFMYSKACELLKIKLDPTIVFDVFEAYRVEGCLISVKTFKVVLNLCREARLADEALWILRKMCEFDLRADTAVYNVVIRLFCEKGDMEVAEKLMKEMELIDLYPDMITYVSMIQGFCNHHRLEDACVMFKVMRGKGCVPNAVAYSALLDGVCRFGSMERALELLGEMEKEGGDCSPNVVTYTSVIQRFCERGRLMEALEILDRMEACNCAPSRVTVSTLIKSLCKEGRVEDAYKMIDKVVAGGSVSYGTCYSSLVVCLMRSKKIKEAEKLFRKMVSSGVNPDSLACSIMIKELCLQGRVLDGYCLYDEIEKMGCLSSIDSDIYSTLLVGLCQGSHSVEAAKLARLMHDKGIRLKAPYVDKIAEHLKKSGEQELAVNFTRIER